MASSRSTQRDYRIRHALVPAAIPDRVADVTRPVYVCCLLLACHGSEPVAGHDAPSDASIEASPSGNALDVGPTRFLARDADNVPMSPARAQHLLETTTWAAENRVTLANAQGAERTPTTCVELLAAREAGFADRFEIDIQYVSARTTGCRAIALLGHASASSVSHVASLDAKGDLRRIAPSEFAFGAEVDAGATWLEAAPRVKRGRVDEQRHWAEYVDPTPLGLGFAYAVTINGFADVDGDGVEDVVMTLQRSNVPGGHMTWTEGFVLTRDTDTGPLRLVRTF